MSIAETSLMNGSELHYLLHLRMMQKTLFAGRRRPRLSLSQIDPKSKYMLVTYITLHYPRRYQTENCLNKHVKRALEDFQ